MTILFDFSRVLLFAKDPNYKEDLNPLHDEIKGREDFDFFDYFELNEEVLEWVKNHPEIECHIFTTGDIQQDEELQASGKLSIFKSVMSLNNFSNIIEFPSKKSAETYSVVAKHLNKEPNEILFIDDSTDNIFAAKEAGLNVIHYIDNDQLFGYLSEIIK